MKDHIEIIPQEILRADIIAGDLNKMSTSMDINAVYHTKNIGNLKKKINQPKGTSDHYILIYQKVLPLQIDKEERYVYILDSVIVEENWNSIMHAALHENQNQAQLTIRNPHKHIKIKPTGIFDTHIDYYNNYQFIKNKNQEKYKQEQLEQAKQLGMLIRNDQIGSTAFDKLATIMQIKTKNEYWIPDDDNIKNKIIEGFQQLYKDDKIIEDKSKQISEIMLHTIEIIEKKNNFRQFNLYLYQKAKPKI